MLTNPYTPGALPSYLAGRGSQLELIRSRLARMRELGRSSGPLLAFYASRGLGKTSLLRAAERDAAAAGYVTVWVTGREDASMVADVLRGLAQALRGRPLADRARDVLAQIDKVQIEVGVPGAKLGVQATTASATAAPAAVEDSLAAAARLARESGDAHGVVVFVDELQEAPIADRRSLLIALQHLDGDPAPVAVVAAGLPAILAAVPAAATFGERSDFRLIGPLVDVAVAEALRLPAEAAQVVWSDDAVVEAIEITRGYPHHVQLLGEAAWRVARPQPGDTIDVGAVRIATEEAAARMNTLFRSRLSKITPEQRRFLDAMADVATDAVARSEIAARLGVDSRALSRPRQELVDRGLIETAGHGRLRFTIPSFGAYLRDESSQA